ncbi:MAG: hypothetical protein NT154_14495, partial [Verrucomicrobia bacterium]|nr:hypothetical protein [Verrucomicrobiota bacterium]
WLYDLAAEISAAEKDDTLPELALDRVWITGEGRAKLLDFPAPGQIGNSEIRSPKSETEVGSRTQPTQWFLANVAAAALEGTSAASAKVAGDVAAPLPLHARAFLKSLSQMDVGATGVRPSSGAATSARTQASEHSSAPGGPELAAPEDGRTPPKAYSVASARGAHTGAEAVATALKPLLSRVAAVSRARRAALVAGCMVFPVLASALAPLMMTFMQDLTRNNPGLMELNTLLQMRASARFWESKSVQLPTG